MSSALLGDVLELCGGFGAPYNILDETGSFGDPQAVTQHINAVLTQGSTETGDFTDNRSQSFQILIQGTNAIELAQAESALRKLVNQSAPNVLRWSPDGGLPVFYDIFRGQVAESVMSWAYASTNAKVVTISMRALPFARSTVQRMLTGNTTSVQLGNFAQPTEYTYTVPNSADSTPYGTDLTLVPTPESGIVYGEQPSPAPIDGDGCMQLSLGSYTRAVGVPSTLAKIGPVTGTWDLSDTTNLTIGVATVDAPGQLGVYVRLGDSHGAFQTFTGLIMWVPRFESGVWAYTTLDLSAASIDITSISSWTMWVGTDNWSVSPSSYYYLGMLRAFSGLAALAATSNGAMYKLAGVLGDAQAPASIEFDRIVGGNILPAADASFESGIGSWVGNGCTLSQSATVSDDGSNSLQMSSISGGVMSAVCAKVAVKPLTQYTASASFRAAVTPRSAAVVITWYDASGIGIHTVSGAIVADTVTGWVRISATGTSPATAAFASATVDYGVSVTSEIHYVDAVMLTVGTSTAFTAGSPLPAISGFLTYRSPPWASITTPVLVAVVAGHATTVAPSPVSGTCHLIVVDVADIAGGAQMVVTQLNNGVAVPGGQVTLAANVVAGGTRWGDFGDLTFPIVDIPSQAGNTTYDFQVTGTDVILCDTRGFLVWVPALDNPANYIWIDEATAFGMGGVFGGTMADRTDAVSLLGADGVQPSGAMSVDGEVDNYLLVYTLDGAPVHVSISYFDRYLGQRTAA